MKRKASALGKGSKPKLARQGASRNLQTGRRQLSIKPELKYNDVTINTDATATETVVALTTIAAGDTALLRDGNKIIVKSIEFRILVANEALTQGNAVRFALVKSMQANAAAPTWFVGTVTTDVFDASTVTARRSVVTASRYKVLMDEVIVVNQEGGTGAAVSQAYFHKYLKTFKEEITQYGDGTASVPMTNAYYLMYVGSVAAGATDLDVAGTARLRFVG